MRTWNVENDVLRFPVGRVLFPSPIKMSTHVPCPYCERTLTNRRDPDLALPVR